MSLVRNLGGARAPAAQSAPAAPGSAAIPPKSSVLAELDERSREIFRQVVEASVETGEPVGSRTLSRKLTEGLSPAIVHDVTDILRTLRDEGVAILLVEQNLATAMKLATRVHVLAKGRVAYAGEAAPLRASPALMARLLGV